MSHHRGDRPGHWCELGTHDGCTGAWKGVTCTCTCHGYTIDLVLGKHDVSVGDRQQLRCFAAFLRHAGARPGGGLVEPVQVNQEWHAWLTGTGPCPDPDSEVGPPVETETCGGNHGAT